MNCHFRGNQSILRKICGPTQQLPILMHRKTKSALLNICITFAFICHTIEIDYVRKFPDDFISSLLTKLADQSKFFKAIDFCEIK